MNAIVYSPILKGKLNDIKAFGHLPISASHAVKPIFEFPLLKANSNKAKAILRFAQGLARFTLDRSCYVDFPMMPTGDRMPDGVLTIKYAFTALRGLGVNFQPCCGFNRDEELWPEYSDQANLSGGILLRLERDDLVLPDTTVDNIVDLINLGVDLRKVNILCDWKSIKSKSDAFQCADYTNTFMSILTRQFKPNSMIVAGSSALKYVGSVPKNGFLEVERWELNMFAEIGFELYSVPITFGDYGVIHPDFLDSVPALNANAKIRYTVGNIIRIERGESLRLGARYAQYRILAKKIMQSGKFGGSDLSFGDRYIAGCSEGLLTTGNLGTWVMVDQSRHIHTTAKQFVKLAKIVEDQLNPKLIMEQLSEIT
jgi:hypothetical protein